MKEKTVAITVKEFIEKLTAGGGEHPSPADCMEYGLQQGWLEAQDIAAKADVLTRKHAARMLHHYLRLELQEADEIDGGPAYVLQDLFDCRVCAGHIIQVYVKGIMDGAALPDGKMIFDGEEVVSKAEADEIVTRIFHKEVRAPRIEAHIEVRIVKEPEEISLEQVMQRLKENENIVLVDVRTEREYEQEHLENTINVPLLSIIKNPFVFSDSRDKMILLYCMEGYQSKAAAQCLLEAGYQKTAYFAWKASNLEKLR